jgi:pimeloyl-ACP methyl ester carboxylesterase
VKALHPRLERRDSTAQWIREKVSYAAAYGGERLTAHVLLPLHVRPPYQTVVFFPGSNTLRVRSSETLLSVGLFDFLVQGGRAVIYPVYKGTYERDDGTRFSDPDASNRYKEHVIQWQKDVSRTLDYLGTRAEVDTTKLAYLGFSWGGRLGGVILAIEPRFEAAVLTVAGLNFRPAQPEVDDLNYLPRVHTPVLMLNGRHDNTFPLETAAKPMFELLGTPLDRKRHVVADGVHYVPRHTLIRETLDWLDRYLGPVK